MDYFSINFFTKKKTASLILNYVVEFNECVYEGSHPGNRQGAEESRSRSTSGKATAIFL